MGTVSQYEPGILVRFCGGLGNKLFQIAAGYAASLKYGCPFYLIRAPDTNHHGKQVDYFDSLFKNIGVAVDDETAVLQSWFGDSPHNRIHNHCCQFWVSTEGYSNDGLTIPVIFDQYFQYYPPLEPYEHSIRALIKKNLEADCDAIDLMYETDRAAFLHVRRGDYLNYPDRHPTLPLSYYEECVGKLADSVDVIYAFSDDPVWVRSQSFFSYHPNIIVMESDDEVYTLAFMSMCRGGAICANSSFSWWGAFLGAHEVRAPVYVPSTWILHQPVAALFPKEWTLV
jgi:hypothetical protein